MFSIFKQRHCLLLHLRLMLLHFWSYQLFCSQTHLQDFPLLESPYIRVQYYSLSMARWLAYHTIKVYFLGCNIIQLWGVFGSQSVVWLNYIIQCVRGIRHVQGPSFNCPRRKPLTIAHLRTVHYRLHFMRYFEFQRICFELPHLQRFLVSALLRVHLC